MSLPHQVVVALATTCLLALPCTTPAVAAILFTAELDSAQEVFPAGQANSALTGSAEMELIDLGGGDFSLDFELNFEPGFNFDFFGVPFNDIPTDQGGNIVTRLHIHNEARGVNGGVVFGLFNPDHDFTDDVSLTFNQDGSATITGSWDPLDGATVGNINDFALELLAAAPGEDVDLYWNLHTVQDPAGEIRGQFERVPEPGTLLLMAMGLGLGAAGLKGRKRA